MSSRQHSKGKARQAHQSGSHARRATTTPPQSRATRPTRGTSADATSATSALNDVQGMTPEESPAAAPNPSPDDPPATSELALAEAIPSAETATAASEDAPAMNGAHDEDDQDDAYDVYDAHAEDGDDQDDQDGQDARGWHDEYHMAEVSGETAPHLTPRRVATATRSAQGAQGAQSDAWDASIGEATAPDALDDSPTDDWSYLGGDVAADTYPLEDDLAPVTALPQLPWQQRILPWLRARTPEQWAWTAVLILAIVLRFWNLGAKPLHHDESMHAFYSFVFAQDPGSYSYNPLLHGPFQFHAEGIMFAIILLFQHLFHVGTTAVNPWITDATARIVPASFGVGIVALPLWLRRELGRAGALIAAFLLAVSPAFVYFSRFLREDIYFNFFMFAMVVCAVRFATSRSGRWFVATCLATVLAYATFEGIYLTVAVFAVFLVGLLLWELGYALAPRLPATLTLRERLFFARALLLTVVGAVGGAIGITFLHQIGQLSIRLNAEAGTKGAIDPTVASAFVQRVENFSVLMLLYFSIALALLVILVLFWQLSHEPHDDPDWVLDTAEMSVFERVFTFPARQSRRIRRHIHPGEQRLIDLVLGISWAQWFVAYVLSFLLFSALYWIIPDATNGQTLFSGFAQGVGSGMWQGLYYWIQQQSIARGGQPWYYYLLLLPLYEQLAIVFGVGGVIYALRRPTRFRVFLVWWFGASLFLYSWAGEKMPWLSIHLLLPLMLLAGLMLNWVAHRCFEGYLQLRATNLRTLFAPAPAIADSVAAADAATDEAAPARTGGAARATWQRIASALPRRTYAGFGLALLALLLLVPMLHSMWTLSQVEPADGPLEMMVYVQTTPDVDLVMRKINRADQLMYHGQHKLKIGVGTGEEWPFYWYLRDYYLYSPAPTAIIPIQAANYAQEDVLILLPGDAQAFLAQHPKGWHAKEYRLRSWFDESYKPAPDGLGLGTWLTYGSTLPKGVTAANAKFNPFTAAGRLWAWFWVRQPLGATDGSYDFTLIVRDGVPMQP